MVSATPQRIASWYTTVRLARKKIDDPAARTNASTAVPTVSSRPMGAVPRTVWRVSHAKRLANTANTT